MRASVRVQCSKILKTGLKMSFIIGQTFWTLAPSRASRISHAPRKTPVFCVYSLSENESAPSLLSENPYYPTRQRTIILPNKSRFKKKGEHKGGTAPRRGSDFLKSAHPTLLCFPDGDVQLLVPHISIRHPSCLFIRHFRTNSEPHLLREHSDSQSPENS